MKRFGLIVAGGKGLRMGGEIPKQFMLLKGKPVLMHTLEVFAGSCDELILVLPGEQLEYWGKLCSDYNFRVPHKMALGGDTRFRSVFHGLSLVPDQSLVAIHDGVRPLVTAAMISESFQLAAEHQGAVATVALKDSIRSAQGAVDRNLFRTVQTPQTFQSGLIRDAYDFFTRIDAKGNEFTDDAAVFEKAGYRVKMFEGSYRNIKITTPEDLVMAELLI